MFKTLLFNFLFFLQINSAYSEVYKWIDENGKTVYGDRPTTENADLVKIKRKPAQDKSYQDRIQKRKKLLDVMQEERDEKISKQKDELEKQEKQEQRCLKLIAELREAKAARLIYEDTDDPNNPRILSDEERKAEEQEYEKYIKENCN